MRSTAFPVALATVLALAVVPTAVAPGPDLPPIVAEIAHHLPPIDVPTCIAGIGLCADPQCTDGQDNDADGSVDGADPSCANGGTSESACASKVVYAEVFVWPDAYSTDVYAGAFLYYSCPGGPRFESHFSDCPAYNEDWIATSCTETPGTQSASATGSFACNGSTCAGALSPHSLTATVTPTDNAGGFTCTYGYPPSLVNEVDLYCDVI